MGGSRRAGDESGNSFGNCFANIEINYAIIYAICGKDDPGFRSMRFHYAESMTAVANYLPLARAAEAHGYAGFTIPDSLIYPSASAPRRSDNTAAMAALPSAILAGSVNRIARMVKLAGFRESAMGWVGQS